jgi:hypothetical protein
MKAMLPIGRTARVACQLDVLRAECCKAAGAITGEKQIDEVELEEAARLDDALAHAQRVLKSTVGRIIIARLKRRSRVQPRGDEAA